MKVVAFSGSARKDGNTAYAGAQGVRRARGRRHRDRAGPAVQQGLPRAARACLKCAETQDNTCSGQQDDGVNACIAKMVEADGIIIASPTYYANCTANTQALMERAGYATRKSGNPLARKVGAAVVAARRGGAIHAFDSINHWFQINEMVLIGSSYWNLGIGLDKGDVENDEEGMQTMVTLGRNMAWALKKLNA